MLRNARQLLARNRLATSVKKTEEQTDTVTIKLKEVRVKLYDRTGKCRHDGNLLCFFLPTHKKEERNPTHIAAHLQAPQANTATNPESFRDVKECNLPDTHGAKMKLYLYF